MNATPLGEALLADREKLAVLWCDRFEGQRKARRLEPVNFDVSLAINLIDEVIVLLHAVDTARIPRRHNAGAFVKFAGFPRNVSRCIEIFEVGSQVMGSYVAANTGAESRWDCAARNRYLNRLDAIFHVLVHREIQGLCEYCLHQDSSRSSYRIGATPAGDWMEAKTTTGSILHN